MLSTNTDTGLEPVALFVKYDVVYGDFHFPFAVSAPLPQRLDLAQTKTDARVGIFT